MSDVVANLGTLYDELAKIQADAKVAVFTQVPLNWKAQLKVKRSFLGPPPHRFLPAQAAAEPGQQVRGCQAVEACIELGLLLLTTSYVQVQVTRAPFASIQN